MSKQDKTKISVDLKVGDSDTSPTLEVYVEIPLLILRRLLTPDSYPEQPALFPTAKETR